MTILRRVSGSARTAGAAAAVAVLAASCTAGRAPSVSGSPVAGNPPAAGPASRSVLPLNKIATLRSVFNRADGHPRLILIFSPT